VSLEAEDRERLLFDFLSEIIFLKDTEGMVFCSCDLTLHQKENAYKLEATLSGALINPSTQELGNDVKAVTMHLFAITEHAGKFTATIVLDI